MLVNTDDGFTGLDSEHPRGNGGTRSVMAYDAGSEVNNELTGSFRARAATATSCAIRKAS
jgi:hypothetical protein